MQNILKSLFVVFFSIFFMATGMANIHVSPATIKFEKGKIKKDFRVYNLSGEETAYVQIAVETVENFGTSEVKNIPTPNPKDSGILVSPTKLAISPKSNRLIRVRLTQPPGNTERHYRLIVSPVEGQAIPVKSPNQEEVVAAIRLIVQYAVNVSVAPAGQ